MRAACAPRSRAISPPQTVAQPHATPKAVIAPHAGYVYSGPVAGHAFAALGAGASAIRRAVVVGPAHFVPFRGIAVPSAAAFRTPLGDVPLDRRGDRGDPRPAAGALADAPHEPEHALEVELPFLQAVLGDFALVPLLVGDATPARSRRCWSGCGAGPRP